MASNIKVDIVRPTATNGSLSLKGDSGGSATTNGVTVNSSGNTSITGTTTVSSLVATTADINGGTIDNATIGETTPAAISATTLNVTANSAGEAVVIKQSGAGGTALRITHDGTSGDALVVEDSTNPDSTPFVVDSTGNVGIGTDSPTTKITILNQSNSASPSRSLSDYQIRLTAATTDTYNHGICATEGGFANAAITPIDTGTGGAQGWAFITGDNTSIAEQMRIDNAGDVTMQNGLGVNSITNLAGNGAPNFPYGLIATGGIVQIKHDYRATYTGDVGANDPVNLLDITTDTFNNSSNYLLIYCAGQFARGNGTEAIYPMTLKLATGGTVSGLTVSGHTVYSAEGNILDNSGGSTVNGQYIAYSKVFKYQLSSTSALTFRVIADDGSSNAMQSYNSMLIFEIQA